MIFETSEIGKYDFIYDTSIKSIFQKQLKSLKNVKMK